MIWANESGSPMSKLHFSKLALGSAETSFMCLMFKDHEVVTSRRADFSPTAARMCFTKDANTIQVNDYVPLLKHRRESFHLLL